jgi:hypothetical protein
VALLSYHSRKTSPFYPRKRKSTSQPCAFSQDPSAPNLVRKRINKEKVVSLLETVIEIFL